MFHEVGDTVWFHDGRGGVLGGPIRRVLKPSKGEIDGYQVEEVVHGHQWTAHRLDCRQSEVAALLDARAWAIEQWGLHEKQAEEYKHLASLLMAKVEAVRAKKK